MARSKAMTVVGVAAAAIALVGCGGGGDQSSTLEIAIQQAPFSAPSPDLGAAATIKSAHCTETGRSDSYTCLVVYSVTSLKQDYLIPAAGSCDNSGNCQWAIPVGVAKPTSQ
ncbi:MAG TPA: hypothetical protein VND96_07875 [Candidatus Micrarchaeaceae archaeon]|nr:hypothetical protein [Candidatus Micrarchaeaceae archaeon]